MSRSDTYVENLTVSLFKVDGEGLWDAVNDGYFNFDDFYAEDPELAEALAGFQAAGRHLEALVEARREEHGVDYS